MTRFLVAVLVLAAAVSVAAAQTAPGLSRHRLPVGPLTVGLPPTPSMLQRAMAELAWSTRVPIGFEAAEDDTGDSMPPARRKEMSGMTVAEVLEAIVASDRRYR